MYGDFETVIKACSCSKPVLSVSVSVSWASIIISTSTLVSLFGGKTAYLGEIEISPCGSFIILKMQTLGKASLFSIFNVPTLISVTDPDLTKKGRDIAPKTIAMMQKSSSNLL